MNERLDEPKFYRSFEKLENWIFENERYGFDPYDFIGSEWAKVVFGDNLNSKIRNKLRRGLTVIGDMYPRLMRKIFLTRKKINPKGMGLIAHAYLLNYERTLDSSYLKKAEGILKWLSINYSNHYKGKSWGYPFNWYSRIYIPKNTPSSVVTGTVSEAFFKHYELTKSTESLKVLNDIFYFFESELNKYKNENGDICFSYTPIDNFRVHNASLFTAVFFAKYFSIIKNDEIRELAVSAMNYVLNEQKEDGSFYYWSQEPESIIDHFHTGYVIRHIYTISEATKVDVKQYLEKALKFYVEHLYDSDGIPKFSNNLKFPKDAHGLAESILSLVYLYDLFNELISKKITDKLLIKSLEYISDNMQTIKGYIVWQIHKNQRKIDFPFHRWSQAWTYLAYSKFRLEYENRNVITH